MAPDGVPIPNQAASGGESERPTAAGSGSGGPADQANPSAQDNSGAGNSSSTTQNPRLRKRTKTGCLTCRKRRIKCGEERPICNNCVKSRRTCEGYNPRIVFRPPMSDWPMDAGPTSTIPYHTAMMPGARPPYNAPHSAMQQPMTPLTPLRPRPTEYDYGAYNQAQQPRPQEPLSAGPFHGGAANRGDQQYAQQYSQHQVPHTPAGQPGYPQQVATPYAPQYPGQEQYFRPEQQHGMLHGQQQHQQPRHQHQNPTQQPQQVPQQQYTPITPGFAAQAFDQGAQSSSQAPQSRHPTASQPIPPSAQHQYPQQAQEPFQYGSSNVASQQHSGSSASEWATDPKTMAENLQAQYTRVDIPHQPIMDEKPPIYSAVDEKPTFQPLPENQGFLLTQSFFPGNVSPTQDLHDAAVEGVDDDYYDVLDEEMEDQEPLFPQARDGRKDISMMLAVHREHGSDTTIRRFDQFIQEGMLDHYRAEFHANPLKNPKTARVFIHFIHATGPSLSIYDRRSRNPGALFSEGPVPPSLQSLWSYTLPLKALHNQGLLHAMLALASLHIARLQGAADTPSFQHYAFALKRIHAAVGGTRKRRHNVTTLAASLLLGFYEVMTGDHMSWSRHLAGAKQLLVEIDYVGMTKRFRQTQALGADRQAKEQQGALMTQRGPMPPPPKLPGDDRVNEGLVSEIIGREVDYDRRGHVEESGHRSSFSGGYGGNPGEEPLDTQEFEIYQDLFWWYCRHDAFQSIVSGNRLLMSYDRWSDCPPRGPIGKPDAVYATNDYLLLLIGRVAEFSARDRRRKLRVMKANGGSWRPWPGFPHAPPAGFPQGQQSSGPPRGPGAPVAGPSPSDPPPGFGQFGPGGPPFGQQSPYGQPSAGTGMGMGMGGPPPGQMPFGGGTSPHSPFGPQMGGAMPPQGYGPQGGGQSSPQTPGGMPFGQGMGQGHGMPPQMGQQHVQGGIQMPPQGGLGGFGGPLGGPPSMAGPPGMGGPPAMGVPPGMGGAPGMGGPPKPPQMPDFLGMAPTGSRVRMPSSYGPSDGGQSPLDSPSEPDSDLTAQTEAAEREWLELKQVLNNFASYLGSAYQPLPADIVQRIQSPFGDALQYRGYDIGVIWAMYHTTQIIHARSHPAMPAAAMMAAGIAARWTAPNATEIGRISAGIVPTPAGTPLSPSLGAALNETTMALFFAGVQLVDQAQRAWTVHRLRDIGKRTGWATAALIAHGCENAWERAGQAGRGPPYTRIRDEKSTDDRLAGKIDDAAHGWKPPQDPSDRRFVHIYPGTRVHWAMGLLSLEEDMKKMAEQDKGDD
ncbi:hypothetical protein BDY21DRAFT_375323 [Lineolata rhizophorae]|uniref:Zn(2)-C6 fungal-type domain-containing protein n=1 Tax=Lineolata rhizophorae TaxID=578093 RepID=A0A6A6NLZ5_9PEZI|nr:hypothetical protein BDY21DRAFT_375323 [Lineolata rhizophorae]